MNEKEILAYYTPATKIIDYLYLGGMGIYQKEFLERMNIKHIVCIKSPSKKIVESCKEQNIKFYNFVTSHEDFKKNFEAKFEALYLKITQAINKGEKIVIHCRSGKHRSVALLIAILMKLYGLDWNEAFKFVKDKRACVNDINKEIVEDYFDKYYNKVKI